MQKRGLHRKSDTPYIDYCKYFISNISHLWKNAELDLKQRFQNLIFPEGIEYDSEKFGTARTSIIFKHLHDIGSDVSRVAALRGFEPRSDG